MIVAGQASGVGTSVAIPAHQAGDMILVFTRGTAAVPAIPAAGGTVPTWTSPQGAIANAIGLRSAYAIATASNHTTGTWTSATHICVLVLRPDSGKMLGLGASSSGNANNTQTIVYPALTCQVVDGSSLAVRVGTRTVADSEIANVPGSYVLQTVQPAGASALMAVFTRPVIANQTAGTVTTTGTNAPYRAHTIEVLEALIPVWSSDPPLLDDFNRANAYPVSGPWEGSWGADGWQIVGGEIVNLKGAGAWDGIVHTILPTSADIRLMFEVRGIGATGSQQQTWFRRNGATDSGYFLNITAQAAADDAAFWRRVSSVDVQLGATFTGFHNLVAGDWIGVQVVGSEMRFFVWKNPGPLFTYVGSRTDPTHTAIGQVGFFSNDPGWKLDGFSAEPFPVYVPPQIGAPSGITSPQTFGAITTRRVFGAGGVAPAAAFSAPQFKLRFEVAGVPSAQAIGALPFGPTVVAPGVPPPTYDLHIVGEYLVGQALVGWTGGNQFGTPFLKNLDFVGVGGVLSAQSFGAVTIRAVISRTPVGVPSAQSFGKVSLRFVLAGVPSAQAFGAPVLISASGLVIPQGPVSAQAFGTPRFRLIALVSGVASAQTFGTVRSRLYVQATGVASAQVFSVPSFKLRFGGTGVGSAQAFGTLGFAFRKAVLGVSSAQSFGIPKALFLVRPAGLGSAQAFGQIVLRPGRVWVVVTGLGSAQAFGTTFDVYNVWVFPVSCLGVDLVGVPDYAEVLTAAADTSVALTNGVEQAVDLDAVTCVPVALDPVEIA